MSDSKSRFQKGGFSTRATHVGTDPGQWNCRAVVPPIVLATTYRQDNPSEHGGFEYSRLSNPTRKSLEECLATLENAKYGLAYASGMAAATNILNLLDSGDHVIAMFDLYGGSDRLLRTESERHKIHVDFVDMTDLSNTLSSLTDKTKLIWIETPSNPTMKLVDIKATVDSVKAKNKDVIVAVDSTFCSPFFQRALSLGADLVMHSCTKYICGHTDVLMGSIMLDRDDLYDRLRLLQYSMGAVPSPMDCYLVCRSIRTLAVRMERHQKNAFAVARFLEKHPLVEKVLFPGLMSHPQYELGVRQMHGYSGMLSFYMKGSTKEVNRFLGSLRLFTLAVSLGGYESLVTHPVSLTHAAVPEELRRQTGVTDNLIRLSVGIEDIQDIIDDLEQALRESTVQKDPSDRVVEAPASAVTVAPGC